MLKVLLISSVIQGLIIGCSPEKENQGGEIEQPDKEIDFGAGDDLSGPWKEEDERKK